MRKIILVIAIIFQFFTAYTQDRTSYKVIVTMENAPFDSLFLFDHTKDRRIFIPSQKEGKFTWQFNIPDSIARTSENMTLVVSQFDSVANARIHATFVHQVNGKDTYIGNLGIEEPISRIYGRYRDRLKYDDQVFVRKVNGEDSVFFQDLIVERFDLVPEQSGDYIQVRVKEPLFALFTTQAGTEKSYEDYLSGYIELSKEYPDSKYLMISLSNNLKRFRSSTDIHLIYDNLSSTHKHTTWGKNIERFFQSRFDNMTLFSYKSGKSESIILDPKKYTLVTFTASYCIPCIEEIPILKGLHRDLSDKVEFVYVSVDRKSDIEKFEKLLVDRAIPWRTVYTLDQVRAVEEAYFMSGIPHNVLVSPDGNMEILDVRELDNREKIYKRVVEGI